MYKTNIFALLTLAVLLFHNSLFKTSTEMYPYIFYSHSRIYSWKTKCSASTHLEYDYQTDCLNYHMSTTCIVCLFFIWEENPGQYCGCPLHSELTLFYYYLQYVVLWTKEVQLLVNTYHFKVIFLEYLFGYINLIFSISQVR